MKFYFVRQVSTRAEKLKEQYKKSYLNDFAAINVEVTEDLPFAMPHISLKRRISYLYEI